MGLRFGSASSSGNGDIPIQQEVCHRILSTAVQRQDFTPAYRMNTLLEASKLTQAQQRLYHLDGQLQSPIRGFTIEFEPFFVT